MVSTSLFIYKSSSPFTNPLVTVPRAPITISITVTFMYQSLFNSLSSSMNFPLLSFSFSFTLRSAGTPKSTIRQVLTCLLTMTSSNRLVEIKWSVCISKSQKVFVFHFPGQMLGCAYNVCLFIFIIYSLRVFHLSVRWWSFTGVWVTASLLKSPGLFSLFLLFSIVL